MQLNAELGERLVCAVLAAQVVAIRDHVQVQQTPELLWRIADALSQLSSVVDELATRHRGADPALNERRAAAVAASTDVSQSLDALAFEQAQRHDLIRQKADCVVTAMQRLAVTEAPQGGRLSLRELAAMYVSDEQRDVHRTVVQQFGGAGASVLPASGGEIPSHESIHK